MDTGFILYEYIELERGNMNQAVLNAKQEMVSEISSKIKESQSTVVVEYRGLSVAEVTELRRALRAEDVDFKVYKNTMAQRAVDELGFAELKESLKGPNAMAFSKDATAPARVLNDAIKEFKKMEFKGGFVEGEYYDKEAIAQIASIPSREVLISKFMGSIQSPISSFARVVSQIAEAKAE